MELESKNYKKVHRMKYGYIKSAVAVPAIITGDCSFNARQIIDAIDKLDGEMVELILMPELCLTSSSCGDLLTHPAFIQQSMEALRGIVETTFNKEVIVVIGAPIAHKNSIYNCAIVIYKGNIKGIVPKTVLRSTPTNESRWFTSSSALTKGSTINIFGETVPFDNRLLFTTTAYSFGIEIGNEALAPLAPGATMATQGADIILNPSAEATVAGGIKATKTSVEERSLRYKCGYMHAGSGWGESTSNAAYAGYCSISECGDMLAQTEPFKTTAQYAISEIDIDRIRKKRITDSNFHGSSTVTEIEIPQKPNDSCALTRPIKQMPFIPEENERDGRMEEIFNIQANALARRISHVHASTCVIGISGGLDSTLALLVTAKACDICDKPHSDIIAITMPGFGTSERTHTNAHKLMQSLGVTIMEIPIKEACLQHFKDIGHNPDKLDITYENSQARERTQVLMDIANQRNGIVIGTGDLSELALGWATYNGDHMSMYSVNCSVPKTLMQHLVRWYATYSNNREAAATLLDIIDTPISPELVPAGQDGEIKQKTEDLVGPYELHDFFLYNFVHNGYAPDKIYFIAQHAFKGKYDNSTIKKWLLTFMRRFFTQQFKRSCAPDGPVTGNCNLNSQIGWAVPSDASHTPWCETTNNIE